jgi:D-alanine transaminase
MAGPFPICYLNGEYTPLREARISPLDRGFLFADSVYEVLPWIDGRFFRFEPHFDRLDRSLSSIRLDPPHTHAQWDAILRELATRNGGADMYVYVQVTRGMEFGRNHAFPVSAKPTVFAMGSALPALTPEIRERGLAAITVEDFRWGRCDIKTTALLANVLMKQQATDAGAQEAIIVRDGKVLEASSSSVLAILDDKLITPPNSHQILPGTTRDAALEFATGLIDVEVRPISVDELRQAREIFIAAATRDLLPITTLDGHAVGTGKTGAWWPQLIDRFSAARRKLRS